MSRQRKLTRLEANQLENTLRQLAAIGATYDEAVELTGRNKQSLVAFCHARNFRLARRFHDQSGIRNPNYANGKSRATINRTTKNILLKAGKDLCTCERCGLVKEIPLPRHHKDRNRDNNVLDNLEILCVSCHSKEHMPERHRTQYGTFI